MAYRSNVAFVLPVADWLELKSQAEKLFQRQDEPFDCSLMSQPDEFTEFVNEADHAQWVVVRWFNARWYDDLSVDLMNEHARKGFGQCDFMRVGDELEDVEHYVNGAYSFLAERISIEVCI